MGEKKAREAYLSSPEYKQKIHETASIVIMGLLNKAPLFPSEQDARDYALAAVAYAKALIKEIE